MRSFEIRKLKTYSSNEFIGLALCIIAFYLTVYWFMKSKIIELNDGCGNDGLTYCSMAMGNVEFAPFSRRTFLPGIINLLGFENIVLSFYLLNIIFVITLIYFSYLILKTFNFKNRYIIISLILLNPHIIRWLFAYPVVTDFLGLLLVIMFFYFFLILKHPRARIIILSSILIILCFVRENMPLTLSFGLIVWSLITRKKISESFSFILISILFTAISFSQPSTINTVQETNILKLAIDQISFFTQSYQNFLMFIYFVFFGLTLMSIRAISILPKSSESYGGIYVALAITTVTSPLFGGEARHFVLASIIFQIYFLLKIDDPKIISFYLFSTFAFWNLGAYGDGSIESFLRVFEQRFVPVEVTYELLKAGLVTWTVSLAGYLILKKLYLKPTGK